MPESDYEQKLYADRLAKLDRIADLGAGLGLPRAEALYPNSFPFTHTLPELIALGAPLSAEELEAHPIQAAVAGRLMSHRAQGKAGFAHLQGGGWATGPDGQVRPGDSAERLQIYVRKDDVGRTPAEAETLFALYKLLDLGDHIGVRGTLMRTRTGELTLKVHALTGPAANVALGPTAHALTVAKAEALRAANTGQPALVFLAKAMLALPDKYHGLEDVELRYRQRYVDLIMNSGTLAKAEVPAPAALAPETAAAGATPNDAVILTLSDAKGKDPRISPAAPQPPGAPFTPQSHRDVSGKATLSTQPAETLAVPGTSAVTDTAAPNAEHNDAPRNVREVFVKRAAILRAIRRFFDARGYLEVETPMMHTVAGGATARPFQTHHNALDIPLSLRIAPELFLKRLVVGGLDRVYEINRNFRNEGISTQHNPEFTMLEFYQAYANYHHLMDLTEELITQVAMDVNGTTVTHFNGQDIDLSKWQKLSMREAIVKFWPQDVTRRITEDDLLNEETAESFVREVDDELMHGIFDGVEMEIGGFVVQRLMDAVRPLWSSMPLGQAIAQLFEFLAEPHLIQPTIIYDFPLAVSPLSKVKPDEPDWVERFEFYIGGFEVGNAFSELNDPADQRRRFEAQLEQKARGDEEAMAAMDEDYVRALGYGLPPTAGEGIGIDRLTMLLTGSRSIRDVILFPLLRPETNPADPKPSAENEPHGESAE